MAELHLTRIFSVFNDAKEIALCIKEAQRLLDGDITYSMTLRLGGGVNITIAVMVINAFAGGDGTAENPYLIETEEQFNRIRNFLGPEYKDIYFRLTAPIDLSSYTNWEPIGDKANPFCGHINGIGFDYDTGRYFCQTISNLTINRPDEDYIGLFGYCASAEIGCLAIVNANVTGRYATGALVGQTSGYIGLTLDGT